MSRVAKGNLGWYDRLQVMRKKEQHKQLVKGLSTFNRKSSSSNYFAFKYVVQHKSGIDTYLRHSNIVVEYGNGYVVKDTKTKDITFYSKKHTKIVVIEKDYKPREKKVSPLKYVRLY